MNFAVIDVYSSFWEIPLAPKSAKPTSLCSEDTNFIDYCLG